MPSFLLEPEHVCILYQYVQYGWRTDKGEGKNHDLVLKKHSHLMEEGINKTDVQQYQDSQRRRKELYVLNISFLAMKIRRSSMGCFMQEQDMNQGWTDMEERRGLCGDPELDQLNCTKYEALKASDDAGVKSFISTSEHMVSRL
jgi:hypothetical protein